MQDQSDEMHERLKSLTLEAQHHEQEAETHRNARAASTEFESANADELKMALENCEQQKQEADAAKAEKDALQEEVQVLKAAAEEAKQRQLTLEDEIA
eukprot:3092410-Amphidinium_carterae.1